MAIAETTSESVGTVARDQLKAFVQRIERVEAEKAELMADLKEIYAEAKAMGFETKVLRKVISIRRMDQNDRAEQEALLDLYMEAIGEL